MQVLSVTCIIDPGYLPKNDKENLESLQKLCLLPDIDNYNERLSYLNLESLLVHLDIACQSVELLCVEGGS